MNSDLPETIPSLHLERIYFNSFHHHFEIELTEVWRQFDYQKSFDIVAGTLFIPQLLFEEWLHRQPLKHWCSTKPER
ncbi:hypothetical protein D1BOALGB6SA_8565 [Olavius sp. associated proteobacterium Delta 1]|nr:hypothetical protein D1BOALGB6SA_8565 [Olavius sp. associated proteobacterium Delta 1]